MDIFRESRLGKNERGNRLRLVDLWLLQRNKLAADELAYERRPALRRQPGQDRTQDSGADLTLDALFDTGLDDDGDFVLDDHIFDDDPVQGAAAEAASAAANTGTASPTKSIVACRPLSRFR